MKLWGQSQSKESQAAGTGGDEFERAADRVSAGVVEPDETELRRAAAEGEAGEALLIRPEWAVFAARAPFEIGAKFYHPAFALSDEQAQALGPKLLPLMQKVTDEWIPGWLGSVGNRNPELFDAVAGFAVAGFVQWQHVQKILRMEAAEAAAARASDGPQPVASAVLPMAPPPKAGDRDEEGRLII